MSWVVRNKTQQKLTMAFSPAYELQPGEVRPIFGISNDFVDKHYADGHIDVLLDASVNDLTLDEKGWPFSPSSCTHAYTFDTNGNILTDTATDPVLGFVRKQTYTYSTTPAQLGACPLTKSNWVRITTPSVASDYGR